MGKRLIGSVGLAPGSDEGTDLTTKGDLHGYSSSNTRVPIGSNDQVLTADSSQALGLKWASGGGATVTTATDVLGSTFSSTSLSFVDITAWTLTKPDITGGKCVTIASCSCTDDGSTSVSIAIEDDGAITARCETMKSNTTTDDTGGVCLSDVSDSDGTTIQMQGRGNGAGTWAVVVDGNLSIPKVNSFAVG